ncbi:MAG: hypothetical protein ABIW36_13540 [Terrimesophilobacter sp.]
MRAYSLDSRAIGYTDTYGQRFMREGNYRYAVTRAGCADLAQEHPFTVEVRNGGTETMTQHTVMLSHAGGVFEPEPGSVEIATGDLVAWACRDADAPSFEVVGTADFFRSARLVNESGYAHAFSEPGDYEWVDLYGSGLTGVVRVTAPDVSTTEGLAEWQKELSQGTLVMISGATADPAEVTIVTGQTVYFAVTKAPGISITDRYVADVAIRAARFIPAEP